MGIIASSTSLKDMSIINRCEQRKRKLQKKLRQIHASMCSKKDSSYPENTVPMNEDKKNFKTDFTSSHKHQIFQRFKGESFPLI